MDADKRADDAAHKRGPPRAESGLAKGACLTTAERGGEPPPGTARYSRTQATRPAKRRVIRVEPWAFQSLTPLRNGSGVGFFVF